MRETKDTLLYILKRILLMMFTFIVIFIICFILIRLLPVQNSAGAGSDPETFYRIQVSLGRMYYDSEIGDYVQTPVFYQLGVFLKNLFAPAEGVSRWGYSWTIMNMATPPELLFSRMPATVLINVYSIVISIPIGLALGIYMALKKNKWQDNVLSVLVMILISVPSFVYAFLLQVVFGYQLGWFNPIMADPEYNSWFSGTMINSMVLPVLAMSFGSIAGFARYTRAELTEVLTSDFMLLARTKGLSRSQATVRHAFRNSLVPIFPMILGQFISVLSGSMVIESIFAVNGVGSLFIESINNKDYDVFQFVGMFYVIIGLVGSLVVDISYGLVDPRIRMGGGKQ